MATTAIALHSGQKEVQRPNIPNFRLDTLSEFWNWKNVACKVNAAFLFSIVMNTSYEKPPDNTQKSLNRECQNALILMYRYLELEVHFFQVE